MPFTACLPSFLLGGDGGGIGGGFRRWLEWQLHSDPQSKTENIVLESVYTQNLTIDPLLHKFCGSREGIGLTRQARSGGRPPDDKTAIGFPNCI